MSHYLWVNIHNMNQYAWMISWLTPRLTNESYTFWNMTRWVPQNWAIDCFMIVAIPQLSEEIPHNWDVKISDVSWYSHKTKTIETKDGLNRDLNPGPLAPKARIIPLDHWAWCPLGPGLSLSNESVKLCYMKVIYLNNWQSGFDF